MRNGVVSIETATAALSMAAVWTGSTLAAAPKITKANSPAWESATAKRAASPVPQ
jgi:hypothetical protein